MAAFPDTSRLAQVISSVFISPETVKLAASILAALKSPVISKLPPIIPSESISILTALKSPITFTLPVISAFPVISRLVPSIVFPLISPPKLISPLIVADSDKVRLVALIEPVISTSCPHVRLNKYYTLMVK